MVHSQSCVARPQPQTTTTNVQKVSSIRTKGRISLFGFCLLLFVEIVGSVMASSEMIQKELDKHFPGHDYTLEDFLQEFGDYEGHRSPELRLLRRTFSDKDAVISASKYKQLLRKALDGTFLDSADPTSFQDRDDLVNTPQLTRKMKKLVKDYIQHRAVKQEIFRLKDYYFDVYEHAFFDWTRSQGKPRFHRIVEEDNHGDL